MLTPDTARATISVRFSWVSWHKPESCLFKLRFTRSTFPLVCGLQGACKSQSLCKNLAALWTILAKKRGPLSEAVPSGVPNLGIVSFSSTLTASLAWLARHGKASGHPEKVPTNTNHYVNW